MKKELYITLDISYLENIPSFLDILTKRENILNCKCEYNSSFINTLKHEDTLTRNKFGKPLIYGWEIKRKYSKNEFIKANIFHLDIKKLLNLSALDGETTYDNSKSCRICRWPGPQTSILDFNTSVTSRNDIIQTLDGNYLVSGKFKKALSEYNNNVQFNEVSVHGEISNSWFQMLVKNKITLFNKVIAGVSPFEPEKEFDGEEVYKCSNMHTIGLNLLSLPDAETIKLSSPIVESIEGIGVVRGSILPRTLLFGNKDIYNHLQRLNIKGINFQPIISRK